MDNPDKSSPGLINVDIGHRLDSLCDKGQRHLRLWSLGRVWASILDRATLIALLLPALVIILSLSGLIMTTDLWSYGAGLTLSMLLGVIFGYILIRVLWTLLTLKADRKTCLTFFDDQLSSKDRLATADEFIDGTPATSFQQAAVEDVLPILDKAERVALPKIPFRLHSLPMALRVRMAGSLGLLLLAAWLQTLPVATPYQQDIGHIAQTEAGTAHQSPAIIQGQLLAETHDELNLTEQQDKNTLSEQARKSVLEKENIQSSGNSRSSSAKSAKIQSTGQSSKSQSSGGSLSASPDSSPVQKRADKKPANTDRKAGKKPARQKSGQQKKTQTIPPKKQQLARQTDLQAGAEGERQKKKPVNNMAASQNQEEKNMPAMMARKSSDRTGMGEAAQQKKSGDKQVRAPNNMGQKKASATQSKANTKASNKSAKKNSAGIQKNDQNRASDKKAKKSGKKSGKPGGSPRSSGKKASARGKKGGKSSQPIKKSRGVASLMLGVPLPDRIKGKARTGYIKKTQEKSEPKTEKMQALRAQDRLERTGLIKPIAHPVMSPALQQIVRDYFEINAQQSPETDKPAKRNNNE